MKDSYEQRLNFSINQPQLEGGTPWQSRRGLVDIWGVDGWPRDLARLNEVFNVIMETSALISRMIMALMVLAILTCIVDWSIPSKIQWLDESFV